MFLDRLEDGIHIHAGLEFEFGLCDAVLRIGLLQLAYGLATMCQQRKEQRHSHEGITPVVAGGIDNAAVALATDDSTRAAHLGSDIDFTHRCSRIRATVIQGHVTQRTRRRQVAHRGAGRMRQHIVGHSDKRVLLDKEFAIFHDDSQTVDIGVHDKTNIGLALSHIVTDCGQILRNGLRGVPEVAGRVAEQFLHLLHT